MKESISGIIKLPQFEEGPLCLGGYGSQGDDVHPLFLKSNGSISEVLDVGGRLRVRVIGFVITHLSPLWLFSFL